MVLRLWIELTKSVTYIRQGEADVVRGLNLIFEEYKLYFYNLNLVFAEQNQVFFYVFNRIGSR